MTPLHENRAVDLFVTYRFLKLLVTPWEKQEAYKLGIIDKNGISKIPLVRTQIGTYATALFLLREHYGIRLDEPQITKHLMENNMVGYGDAISEEVVGFGNMLPAGEYTLKDMVTADDDEIDAQKGDKVTALEDTPPSDRVLGVDIFPVVHQKSNKKIYVSLEDIND